MVITNDVLNICARLREQDPLYFVVFNQKTKRYELHRDYYSLAQTLVCELPYDRLDNRTLQCVRQTRVERYAELIAEMDAHNARIDRQNTEATNKRFYEQLESGLSKL